MPLELLHLLVAAVTLLCCLLTATLFARLPAFKEVVERKGRFGSLDGLRGYLALGVCIHHFMLTWYLKSEGMWGKAGNPFINNAGKIGVALFFMISGFLFIRKVAFSDQPIDWAKLYRGRFFRIVPLYFFAVLIVFVIAGFKASDSIAADPARAFVQAMRWLCFTSGPIGDYWQALLIICGVEWTLRYEWLFYFSLPILQIWMRLGRVANLVLIGLCVLLFFFPKTLVVFTDLHAWELFELNFTREKFWEIFVSFMHTQYLLMFMVGGIAAWLQSRSNVVSGWLQTFPGMGLGTAALVGSWFYPNTEDFWHMMMVSLFFLTAVHGNQLFGLLKLKGSLVMGEISYSIYLMHGIVIFLAFSTAWSPGKEWTEEQFVWLMPVIGVAVVVVSAATFLGIERVGMRIGRRS
ncbi:acyltransferase family protein [Pelagicoccus mobilis]|uniref:Acyltransferase n=1 Tax=Pelagicoccus mobilis TaxID=415221 RepID=A0A934RW05_9BACT|nr:acyltransferase [Pelagicoccus mobilis]MBK1878755.1 acyltransferase [Pelagicoccus mobilis]